MENFREGRKAPAARADAEKFWEGRKVIVTGANGFIGGWLCRTLVERNAAVTALVHSEIGMLRAHGIEKKLNVEKADILDRERLAGVFGKAKPEICFHLAARSRVRQAMNDRAATMNINVEGTRNALEASKEADSAFVFASSGKVYGGFEGRCIDERHALGGKSVYAESKIAAEKVCRGFAEEKGMSVGIARFGNVFGGFDPNLSRIVPGAAISVLHGAPPRVAGRGESVFDFVYVEDAVEGLLLLGGKALEERLGAEAFNFGSGKGCSLKEVVAAVQRVAGTGLEPVFSGEEPGTREVLCISKAGKGLGWKPRFGLEPGLKKTVDYFKSAL